MEKMKIYAVKWQGKEPLVGEGGRLYISIDGPDGIGRVYGVVRKYLVREKKFACEIISAEKVCKVDIEVKTEEEAP